MSIFLARQALGETKKPSRSLRCSSKRTLVVQGASADVDGIENHYDMLKIFSRAGPGNITAMSQLRECLLAVQATTQIFPTERTDDALTLAGNAASKGRIQHASDMFS